MGELEEMGAGAGAGGEELEVQVLGDGLYSMLRMGGWSQLVKRLYIDWVFYDEVFRFCKCTVLLMHSYLSTQLNFHAEHLML